MQQMDRHHIGLFFGRSPDPHYSFGLCNHGRASRPVCRPRRPVFHLVHQPQKTRLFHMEFNLRRVCHSGKIQFGPGNIASHRIADLSVLSGQNPAPKIVLACDPMPASGDFSFHDTLRNSRLPKFYQRYCPPNPLLQNHGTSRRNHQSRMGLYRVSDPTILPEHRNNRHHPVCNRSGGDRFPSRIAPDLILPRKLPVIYERHDRQLSQKFCTGVPIYRHLHRRCVLQSACGIESLVSRAQKDHSNCMPRSRARFTATRL